jgi:hypothetical protein
LSQLIAAIMKSEKLVAETGIIWESKGRGTSAVGSRYQAGANED